MAGTLTLGSAEAPVAKTGGSPKSRTITLSVESMHCGGCIRKVETALAAVPGVTAARANLSTRRVDAIIEGRPRMTAEPLIAALHSVGFEASELALDDPKNPEGESDLVRRLAVAGFATANIMLLSVSVWLGHSGEMEASLQAVMHWLSAVIAIPAVAYAGMPFFSSAIGALKSGRVNMDVPISLGVLLATGMSLYQVTQHSEQVYFDAAICLLFFLLIGRTLDQRMRKQAAGAAENLLGLVSPATTVIHDDGRTERLATRTIVPGQRVLIASGERVPVDAKLTRGSADIDESLITGETKPRHAQVGDALYAGTINLSGPIEAIATACDQNTLLAEITRLMQTAEQARGKYVRLADRAASLYAPAVHILGATTFIGWLLTGHGWQPALTAAIAVLIITCPCALALAVPAVQVAAIGRLFRHGIIVRAPDGLERLSEVDTIVLDKTGTLTLGEPRLEDAAAVEPALLKTAASLAVASRHPYSCAIVKAALERGVPFDAAQGVEEVPGSGLRLVTPSGELKLGSAAFCGAPSADGDRPTLWFKQADSAPIPFHFNDPLRPDAAESIANLKKHGYTAELLSGDRAPTVAAAAAAAGIGVWKAEVRPDGKAKELDQLKAKGRKVLMAGDGLNDAPALAAGHASIAPSTATDISQTAADVVFQGQKLAPILETLVVAKAAHKAALTNFALAIGYNVIFVPLAMAGLVTPLIAAIAMSASSITVTANAIWLGHKHLEGAQ